MANDPPFATLNHFPGDSEIPRESDNPQIGITSEAQPPDQVDNLFEPAPSGYAARGRFDDEAKTHVLSINPTVLRTTVGAVVMMVTAAAAVMAIILFG